jgi:mannose-6-phosphate isomerase-like protein (cupin superfamily)
MPGNEKASCNHRLKIINTYAEYEDFERTAASGSGSSSSYYKRKAMTTKTQYADMKPFVTKDGSLVRELMHPAVHGNKDQSLAEAIVPVGVSTLLHRHLKSEELYHIIEGDGVMSIGDRHLSVSARDTVYIPRGMPHKIRNSGSVPLKILCCCYPAYSHDDTELLS